MRNIGVVCGAGLQPIRCRLAHIAASPSTEAGMIDTNVNEYK
jgi:hypothetical protein